MLEVRLHVFGTRARRLGEGIPTTISAFAPAYQGLPDETVAAARWRASTRSGGWDERVRPGHEQRSFTLILRERGGAAELRPRFLDATQLREEVRSHRG